MGLAEEECHRQPVSRNTGRYSCLASFLFGASAGIPREGATFNGFHGYVGNLPYIDDEICSVFDEDERTYLGIDILAIHIEDTTIAWRWR